MAFYARSFTFDGIQSERFSLTISSADSNATETSNMVGDSKLYTEKLFRRTDEFLLGVSIDPVLEFPITCMTDNTELTAPELQLIGNWLFGKRNYAELRIMQPDMGDVLFDCFLINPKIIRVGNLIRGVSATVHCKNAWGLKQAKTYTYSTSPITHDNLSDESGYTYPTLVVTTDAFGGTITWVNTSDANRTGILTSMQANEVITIDNSLQIISSSTGLRRLANFNKNFFRLVNGRNTITFSGALASFAITYSDASKIGG